MDEDVHRSAYVVCLGQCGWVQWFCILTAVWHNLPSHTRTVVRVFKRRRSKSMEKAKIWPLTTPKPLNRSSQKLAGVIMSWTALGMQNFVAIGSGVSVPQIPDFACFWGDLYVRFLGSSMKLPPTPLDGYLRKICQMTSFRVGKCLLRAPMTIFYIWTLKFPKNRHFGDRFWLDSFFAPETALTWGCSNINYPKSTW